MKRPTVSDSTWKTLLISVWLIYMALNLWASMHAER